MSACPGLDTGVRWPLPRGTLTLISELLAILVCPSSRRDVLFFFVFFPSSVLLFLSILAVRGEGRMQVTGSKKVFGFEIREVNGDL